MKIKKIKSILFLCLLSSKTLFSQFYTEDFADILPDDWTTIEVVGNNTASSIWTHTEIGPTGSFPIAPLSSTTANNGWVMFDSSLNCAQGDGQDAWLISPEIDATNIDIVWLQFETYYQTFNDKPQLRIGTDMNDLDSWASIELFPNITANQYAPIDVETSNSQQVNVNLTNLTANSTFRFAFQFLSDETTLNGGDITGCAYSWQIDDVAILNHNPTALIDLRINPFYAITPNAITPKSQIEPIAFIADIQNIGLENINNSTLDINILNSLGESVFYDQLSYETIASGEIKENMFFTNFFMPSVSPQIYQGNYVVTPVDVTDENPTNNEKTFHFEISDTTFSKSTNINTSASSNSTESAAFTFGNVFHVPNGEGMFARYVQFGVWNADELAGETVQIYLYRWAGDTNDDGNINPAEIISGTGGFPFQAFTQYEFEGDENGQVLTLPISSNEVGVPLADDSYYLVCVQYDGGIPLLLLASNENDYNAMRYVTESFNMPRYAAAFDQNNTGTYSFVQSLVPIINMSIGNNSDIFTPPLSNNDIFLSENAVRAFPNPASKTAIIKFDLKETSTQVKLELFNSTGKLIQTFHRDNIFKNNIEIGIDNLLDGNYVVKVHTDFGNQVIKLVVVN